MGMAYSSAAVLKNPDNGAYHDAPPPRPFVCPVRPFARGGGTPPLRPCGMSAHRLHGFGRSQAFGHIW
jgi:hypothetical protein